MNTTRQPSVAVVGCGQWGKNHVRVLHGLGAQLTLCDGDGRVLAGLQSKYPSCRTTQDYAEVLSDSGIEAVVVATPAGTHFSLTRQALLAGKDVLVEKPMAMDYNEGAELARLARERQRVLMVGHLLRYHPAVVKLKELAKTGEMGDIQYVYSNRLNMGRVRREENALWSFAPHDISVILYLLDALPIQVSAAGGAYLQPAIADVSVSSLLFASGARGHIFVSWLHPFKEQKLVAVGTRRMAVFDDSQPKDKLGLYEKGVEVVNGAFVTRLPARQSVPIDDVEPLLAECQHFLECVANRAVPITNGHEGLRVLAVLEACQKSLQRNGEPVRVFAVSSEAEAPADERRPFVHPSAYVDEPVSIGEGTKVWHFSHIMPRASIGRNCVIGQNAFIGKGVHIGDGVKIQNNVSVYEGVTLEDEVFCGPSMVFTNVINPRSAVPRRDQFQPTLVRRGVSLGANSTILCGITVGRYAFVGAGAVVTKDVPDYALVVGAPARRAGWMCRCGVKLAAVDGQWRCPECGTRYAQQGNHLEPEE